MKNMKKNDPLTDLTEQVLTEAEKSKKDLKKMLHDNIVDVVFVKVNGEKRKMHCTLKADLLPAPSGDPKSKTPTGADNPNIVAVWDLEANGWRSFKLDSVISVKIAK